MIFEEGLRKINPIKRNQVRACIEVAENYKEIQKMVIFGSSVRADCTEESDVDICLWVDKEVSGIEMYKISRDLSLACDHNCDVLKYHKLDEKMKAQVDKKGVLVYEFS